MRTTFITVAALVFMACTPAPGKFCSETDASTCWDVNLRWKTAAIVWPNGMRSPPQQVEPGEGEYDYTVKSVINGSQVQIKVIDRNTLGIRNSDPPGAPFRRFVRQ